MIKTKTIAKGKCFGSPARQRDSLVCLGWLPIEFLVNGRATKQALYICDRVERLYFSKKACIDVGILPKSFPFPNTEYPIANTYQIQDSPDPASLGCTKRPLTFQFSVFPRDNFFGGEVRYKKGVCKNFLKSVNVQGSQTRAKILRPIDFSKNLKIVQIYSTFF